MEEPKAGGVGEHLERALKLSGFVGVASLSDSSLAMLPRFGSYPWAHRKV